MTSPRRLDPDALAALEEERDFLLRSLDDLDAELSFGDLDEADYRGLKDDYTRRAAEVIRSIQEQRAAFQAASGVRWKQALVWLVGLAILGGLSGLLIARSSGARTAGDSISGDVRQSVVTRLNEAQRLFSDPSQWDAAIEIYDSVLDDAPSSEEALTYRGWLAYRRDGSATEALAAFEEVARIDPNYPDAIVFRAIVLADEGQYSEAAGVLDTLDLQTAPPEVLAIVSQRGIPGEVHGEASYEDLMSIEDPTLADLGLSVDSALAAAGYLFGSDKDNRSIAVLKLYRAVQKVDPDNAAALSREAWLLFQTFDPELIGRALELVGTAVDAHPDDPEPLLTRASILVDSDISAACADLDRLQTLQGIEPQFVTQAESLAAQFCE